MKGTAREIFSLGVVSTKGEGTDAVSLVQDPVTQETFWVYSSLLEEEVEIPEPPSDYTDVFSEWMVCSTCDDEQAEGEIE